MNPLQRAAFIRKAIYIAAIVVLFTLSMVWRGVIPVPLGSSTASVGQPFRWAQNHTIQSQAERLEVWELDPNETEADITGSAVRLLLTGSRGIAVTITWLSAIDKQKRNDFQEFEDRVGWVTKLQPNFIAPWLFQSWNITYNVSVEMQGSGDMYYYIIRGVQLLAEGERRNKRSPDMRWWIGFYYQNKFGVSDQVETLRCLFDLSCMPPSERNPANFEDKTTKEINYEEFRKFCEKHPHFVRRLRGEDIRSQDRRAKEKLRAPTPEAIIQFLKDNYEDLPCRYRKDKRRNVWTNELAEPDQQFPVLPPQFNEGPDEPHPLIATPDDFAPVVGYFSAYKAARAWFSYSLVLLPPPLKDGAMYGRPDTEGNPLPGPTPPPGRGGHDPSKHRIPRQPIIIIFRQGAPRAQSYQAELEQKEGWYDTDGWLIEGWFPNQPDGVLVGDKREWSRIEWQRAFQMWDRHGKAYALSLDDVTLKSLERIAGDTSALPTNASPEQLDTDLNLRKRYMAINAIQYYSTNRSTTNFPYFLASSDAEQLPLTVQARKKLWLGEQANKIGDTEKAIRLYKEGLDDWKKVLEIKPSFHRLPPPDRSSRGEEDTYEYELAYQRILVRSSEQVRERANQIAHTAHGVIPFLTTPFSKGDATGQASTADPFWPTLNKEELKWFVVENVAGAPFSSPFVGSRAADGTPWIPDDIKEMVRQKQGVSRGAPLPPPQPPPGGPTPVPRGQGMP